MLKQIAPHRSIKYCRIRADTPATPGDAIDVPDLLLMPHERLPPPTASALFMGWPGADMSGLIRPSNAGPIEEK